MSTSVRFAVEYYDSPSIQKAYSKRMRRSSKLLFFLLVFSVWFLSFSSNCKLRALVDHHDWPAAAV
jgi:hypothetical protein